MIIPPLKKGESKIMKNKVGKTMYWFARCNRWTYTQVTGSHKTKDELDKGRNASANISQVSFEDHLEAYKLDGPHDFNGFETTATYRLSLWNLAPILFVHGFAFGPDIYTLLSTVAKALQDNWLHVVTTTNLSSNWLGCTTWCIP